MDIGVLLLAAGRSRRFGADKRRALLPNGKGILQSTVEQIDKTGLPLRICLSDSDTEIGSSLLQSEQRVIFCKNSGLGMGATIAEGMNVVQHWKGVIIALADMPWVEPSTYLLLSQSIAGGLMSVPTYNGRRGNPVAFDKCFFSELQGLKSTRGARTLISDQARSVNLIPVNDAGILRDVDTRQDIV